ncbi:MAG: hypothetical protein Q4A76_00145 [Porphyromonadaceae bacterium]|jgi:anti-repressor protein|nr:hypothetical protein [Porphyromonadaceae bacterium]
MEERKQIQIFNNPEFGDVRIIQGEDGEPRFCLLDICRVLDLKSFKVNQRLNDNILSKYAVSDSIGRQHVVSFTDEDMVRKILLIHREQELYNSVKI